MRLLSLSQNSLPDPRVEKAAYSAKKAGHTVFFAGPQVNGFAIPGAFQKTFSVPFERKANLGIPPYWGRLRKKLVKVLSECKADLIHAHNLVAGKLASEFDLPFVYDDHEYWSVSLRAKRRTRWYHAFSQPYKRWLSNRREDEVLEKASAVIVISEALMEEHSNHNNRIFVVPNFPSVVESKQIKISLDQSRVLSSVYVGRDCSQPSLSPYRNVSGLVELFLHNEVGELTVIGDDELSTEPTVFSLGYLSHQELMNELAKHHLGLLPWKKHWVHSYANPNKPYEYAHAGLLTLSISDMTMVLKDLRGFIKTFEDYEGLIELLTYYTHNIAEILEMKPKIREYALKNLVWEKNEWKILKSYSRS